MTPSMRSLSSPRPTRENQGPEVHREVYAGRIVPAEKMPKDRKGGRKRKREEKEEDGEEGD